MIKGWTFDSPGAQLLKSVTRKSPPIDAVDVIFRVWRGKAYGNGVLALFPGLEWSRANYEITSYEHIGQHGGADYPGCIARTRPATPAEYAPLKRELEQIGYVLNVRKRRTR